MKRRVLRGGSHVHVIWGLRFALPARGRDWISPEVRGWYYGFRLVIKQRRKR